jgi:hypothetical protein
MADVFRPGRRGIGAAAARGAAAELGLPATAVRTAISAVLAAAAMGSATIIVIAGLG